MNPHCIKNFAAFFAFLLAFATAVCAQTPTPTVSPTPFPLAPGLPQIVNVEKPSVISVDPAKLPPPFQTESARRSSRVIPQPENAKLVVPKGFKVNVFAEGDFRYPRWMVLAPNGDVFVAN